MFSLQVELSPRHVEVGEVRQLGQVGQVGDIVVAHVQGGQGDQVDQALVFKYTDKVTSKCDSISKICRMSKST